jgi:hypothetical protein
VLLYQRWQSVIAFQSEIGDDESTISLFFIRVHHRKWESPFTTSLTFPHMRQWGLSLSSPWLVPSPVSGTAHWISFILFCNLGNLPSNVNTFPFVHEVLGGTQKLFICFVCCFSFWLFLFSASCNLWADPDEMRWNEMRWMWIMTSGGLLS